MKNIDTSANQSKLLPSEEEKKSDSDVSDLDPDVSHKKVGNKFFPPASKDYLVSTIFYKIFTRRSVEDPWVFKGTSMQVEKTDYDGSHSFSKRTENQKISENGLQRLVTEKLQTLFTVDEKSKGKE